MFQRLLTVLALVLVVGVTIARAQSDEEPEPTAPDRSYKLLREDEDWGFLRDSRLRRDPWDRIKYIRLRKNVDDWYLTIGGEAREVWEQIGNNNWGQQPFMNGYLNQRYMLSLDLRLGCVVRLRAHGWHNKNHCQNYQQALKHGCRKSTIHCRPFS